MCFVSFATVRFGAVAACQQFITWAAGIGQKQTFLSSFSALGDNGSHHGARRENQRTYK